MPPPLQFPIHLVEQHIGQQRRQRPALRRALKPLHDHAATHDPGHEVTTDQPQHGLVLDSPRQAFHQDVVIDPVEELLQIHIDHHPVTVLHVALCIEHRVVRTASRAKAIAMVRERRINPGLQDLQQGLLDQPIRHRRNPQFAHPAIGLRDLDAAHRRRPVAAIQQGLPNPRPVRSQVGRRLGDRQPIHPSTAAIGFDAFPRRLHVRFRERLKKQAISPRASGFMPRRPCFITHRFGIGFTSPSRVAPRPPELLMHCTSERHGLRPSYSFGPSPAVSSLNGPTTKYYSLC
ncbi:protein of unknown function [Thauera humireducens]|nr:protein of unknown function [Thauera humireducens]